MLAELYQSHASNNGDYLKPRWWDDVLS